MFKKALASALPVIRSDDFEKRRQAMQINEKQAVLRARSIGPKIVAGLEEAGYGRLDDFAVETPEKITFRI